MAKDGRDARATRPEDPGQEPARAVGRGLRHRRPRPPSRRVRRDPHHPPRPRDHRRLGGRPRMRHGGAGAVGLGHEGDDHGEAGRGGGGGAGRVGAGAGARRAWPRKPAPSSPKPAGPSPSRSPWRPSRKRPSPRPRYRQPRHRRWASSPACSGAGARWRPSWRSSRSAAEPEPVASSRAGAGRGRAGAGAGRGRARARARAGRRSSPSRRASPARRPRRPPAPLDAERAEAILTGVLDDLGSAHHRPSRAASARAAFAAPPGASCTTEGRYSSLLGGATAGAPFRAEHQALSPSWRRPPHGRRAAHAERARPHYHRSTLSPLRPAASLY